MKSRATYSLRWALRRLMREIVQYLPPDSLDSELTAFMLKLNLMTNGTKPRDAFSLGKRGRPRLDEKTKFDRTVQSNAMKLTLLIDNHIPKRVIDNGMKETINSIRRMGEGVPPRIAFSRTSKGRPIGTINPFHSNRDLWLASYVRVFYNLSNKSVVKREKKVGTHSPYASPYDYAIMATALHTKEPKHIVERAYRKEKIAADKVVADYLYPKWVKELKIEVFRNLEDEISDSFKKTLSEIEKLPSDELPYIDKDEQITKEDITYLKYALNDDETS